MKNKKGAMGFLAGVILVVILVTVLMYIFFNNGTFNEIFKSVSEKLSKPNTDPSSGSSTSYYNNQDRANKFNNVLVQAFSDATKSDKPICLVSFNSLNKEYYNNWYVLNVQKTDDGVAIRTLKKTKADQGSSATQVSDTINVKGVDVCIVDNHKEAKSFVDYFLQGKPISSGDLSSSTKNEVSISYDFNNENLWLYSTYQNVGDAKVSQALFNTAKDGPKTFLVKDGKSICFIRIYKGTDCTTDVKDGAISSGCLSDKADFSLLTQTKKYPNYLCNEPVKEVTK